MDFTMDDVQIKYQFREGIENYETNTDNDVLVLMSTKMDDATTDAWRARDFVSKVQMLRKSSGLLITDKVKVFFVIENDDVSVKSILKCKEEVESKIPTGTWFNGTPEVDAEIVSSADHENFCNGGGTLKVWFVKY